MARTRNLGELLDEMYEIREQMRDLDSQHKALKAKYDETELEALEEMRKQGVEKASGSLASASISETEVPSVTDWDKVLHWIKRNSAFQLFERRISKGAWVELVAGRKGKALPGIEAVPRTRLNVRTR